MNFFDEKRSFLPVCALTVNGEPPKSRLHHSQKTYHAKIQGGVIDFEGSEAQGTPCNGALGAPEVPGEVLAEWYCESLK